jgi:hypothetical protein
MMGFLGLQSAREIPSSSARADLYATCLDKFEIALTPPDRRAYLYRYFKEDALALGRFLADRLKALPPLANSMADAVEIRGLLPMFTEATATLAAEFGTVKGMNSLDTVKFLAKTGINANEAESMQSYLRVAIKSDSAYKLIENSKATGTPLPVLEAEISKRNGNLPIAQISDENVDATIAQIVAEQPQGTSEFDLV